MAPAVRETAPVADPSQSGDPSDAPPPEDPSPGGAAQDEPAPDRPSPDDAAAAERIRRRLGEDRVDYDCAPWAGESRALLASLLDSDGIEHAWQGTTLTVHARDADDVDDLLDEVVAVASPALSDDAPRVVYEVGGWPVAFQTELAEALTTVEIPYEWNEDGDLVVYEEHEEEVEAILEAMPDPDESDDVISSDDGLVVHRVLDRVHSAATRLARDPHDARAVLDLDEAGADVARMAPPFGFSSVEWRSLVALVDELVEELHAVGDDAAGDDDIVELAVELRDVLAGYV